MSYKNIQSKYFSLSKEIFWSQYFWYDNVLSYSRSEESIRNKVFDVGILWLIEPFIVYCEGSFHIYLIHCSNNENDISSNILDLIQEREPFNVNYAEAHNGGIIVNHHQGSTLLSFMYKTRNM